MTTIPEKMKSELSPPTIVVFLTVVYLFSAVYFALGITGAQTLAPAWYVVEPAWPYFVAADLLGFVSGLALLKWWRWGFYGMILTWIITASLNLIFPRPIPLGFSLLAWMLVGIFVWQVRRSWNLFR